MAAEQPSSADVEEALLARLDANGEIPDSRSFASSLGVPHKDVEDVIKRLCAFRIVESVDMTKEALVLTDEAKGYAAMGSPEVHLVAAIPPGGASRAALKEIFGDVFDIAMKAAAKKELIGFEKENKDLVLRKVGDTKDELQELLKRWEKGEVIAVKEIVDGLKRRKLLTKEKSIWYSLKKGPEFVVKRKHWLPM